MARTSLPPGFRFHPTDVELIMYYLKRKVMGKQLLEAISELNIYKFSPWDLPDKSCLKSKDLEWYFFCPRERKYASGARMNRATETGYWKTTGKDRPVIYNSNSVGMVKTLVFHQGNAPRGQRTDWVIYEYRIEDKNLADTGVAQDAYVLCKVFKKNGPGPKNGAQYGAPFKEEEWEDDGEVSIYSLLADGPSPVVVGLPENENSAAAISMFDLGNAPGLSLNEPGPSLVVPSNDEVLLYGQDSSIVPSIVDHGNSSVWSFSETCLSSARNSAHNMILDTPDDDDIVNLLAYFSEDGPLLHTENENNMKLGDVDYQRGKEGIPHSDESDLFNGLEDRSNCAGGVNEGGHNILGTRDNGYPVDNMLPEDDMTFLELDDFDAPLNFSAESLVSEQMQTGGLFRACNYGGNEQMMTDSLCSQYNNTNSDLRQVWYDCNFPGYDPHV